jgi:hypothetical protein
VALAAALYEYLATAFQDGRWTDGRHVTRLLREGRLPLRAALGMRAEASPQAVADALLTAATAGRRGDVPAAEATLAAVALPGMRPWSMLAMLDPRSGGFGPLRRALRAARDMVTGDDFSR